MSLLRAQARTVLRQVLNAQGAATLRRLLERTGAKTLGDVPEDKLPALIEAAKLDPMRCPHCGGEL